MDKIMTRMSFTINLELVISFLLSMQEIKEAEKVYTVNTSWRKKEYSRDNEVAGWYLGNLSAMENPDW